MSNQLPGLLPLDGITVVSFEQAVAAPIATRHLADLGARVIKVERIGEGDFARNYDSAVHGIASHFVWLNRGKESVTVDLKAAEGVSVIRKLVGRADVVVQNLAPDAMDRLGLGAEVLRRDRPELIVVNMTGYGTDGPLKDRKAYDMLVQAETGLCSITGTPETATKTGVPASDIAAGMYALTAVQAALFRRERTGVGAVVNVSMFDATVEWLGHPMYLQMYQDTQVQRMGLSHASISPYDAYPTIDGRILIGVQNDRGWRALVTDVFDRPDLAEHPKFATNILRVRHRAETDAVVAEHTRRFDTGELDKRLAAAGVPAARLNDMRDLIDHPQLSERDRWRRIDTESGQVRAVLPPMTFTDVELPMGPVPALGQHTDAVLAELGLTDAAIAGLRTGGTVG
ncbi:formyl-CoA transferase [Rhodococcus wratislaviensis]|uniref:CaiB/BaiF family protein n=1 Tax=Rhodococcus wratislaviensis TaxID=44752 RepID=A0AB38FD17_RHOWR|nr:CaiB/BaiF CoA-transferase family protein [Rhodococcus wratislaviensis]REE75631.1 formyl-CoA transferase [Rhodococcus wratislaviensis]SPZ39333.1 CaiB/BaiF family protein [Rhodococcus wratislaviensis]